jgi:hypothetical protein
MSKVFTEHSYAIPIVSAHHTFMGAAAAVVVVYFTKWIEAKPLVNIAIAELKRFFGKT